MRVWNPADDKRPPRDFVVIAISDTEPGMSAAILKRAFEPFYATTSEDTVMKFGDLTNVFGSLRAAPAVNPHYLRATFVQPLPTRPPPAIGCIRAYERFIELAPQSAVARPAILRSPAAYARA
jgi:hypothetical protein